MNNTVIYKQQSKLYMDVKLRDLKVLRITKKVFEAALRTTLFIALMVSIVTVITSNTDYLFGIKSFTVLSGSMEPRIGTGSIIYTMKNLGYNLGDVITFTTPSGMTVTHRIVGITSNGEVNYTTKGDANNTNDTGTVTNEQIIGKTYFSIPHIGKVVGILKDPKGLFTVVFFPALIVILYELWIIKKEIEKGVEKRLMEKINRLQGGAHTHSPIWQESIS